MGVANVPPLPNVALVLVSIEPSAATSVMVWYVAVVSLIAVSCGKPR